jgi:hypothetical protein
MVPNQQILPALDWLASVAGGLRKKIFLLGSDLIFPRTANYIAKKYLATKEMRPVGEAYVPLGDRDFSGVVKEILASGADCVLSTVNGDSNIGLFAALAKAEVDPAKIPVMTTSIAEDELRFLVPKQVAGHYAAACYFQSLDTPANRVWIDGCRELIQNAAAAANGSQVVMRPAGGDSGALVPVDISGHWATKTVHDAVSEAIGQHVDPDTEPHTLRRLCDSAGIPYLSHWDAGALVLEMYEHLVEGRTEAPTFYTDFPTSVSPLTRPHRTRPGVAERWDLVAWGMELGTAYSELTDPVEQRRRLKQQSLLAAGGDPEAMELDEDFLQAMEYAMPPTGGLGVGVDRVVMLITGRSIRETLPFPLAKPR